MVDPTPSAPTPRTLHLDPLAYLIGLQGAALMRAFAGEHDAAFVEARLSEVTRLLADRPLLGSAADLAELTVADGYDLWSAHYDDPGNGLLAPDLARVTALIDDLPGGVALDLACGTGRYAQWLIERGHRVTGVDASPGMLEVARAKLPDVEFVRGDLHALPIPTAHAELAVCALALTHVEDLTAPYREMARVLRPGGRLVVSDTHPLFQGSKRYPLVQQRADGAHRWMPGWAHSVADHVRAALAAGLRVTHVEEFTLEQIIDADIPRADLGSEPVPDPWPLMTWASEAANAAHQGRPASMYLQYHLDA